MIVDPDVSTYSIGPSDDFFIVGTDGLYDCLSNQDIVDFVHSHIQRASVTAVAKKLTRLAVKRGSQDNITCIICLLKPQKDIQNTCASTKNVIQPTPALQDSKSIGADKTSTSKQGINMGNIPQKRAFGGAHTPTKGRKTLKTNLQVSSKQHSKHSAARVAAFFSPITVRQNSKTSSVYRTEPKRRSKANDVNPRNIHRILTSRKKPLRRLSDLNGKI